MLAWIYLSAAIASEVIGTVFLRYTDGVTRPAPWILVIATYALSLWLTALALPVLLMLVFVYLFGSSRSASRTPSGPVSARRQSP